MNWRKASYSGDSGGACVEVASASGLVMIRDTTNRDGATLSITPTAWHRLLTAARREEAR